MGLCTRARSRSSAGTGSTRSSATSAGATPSPPTCVLLLAPRPFPPPADRARRYGADAPQVEKVRAQFDGECAGEEPAFFKVRPQAFRWACCGAEGPFAVACYHHGGGSEACTCTLCRKGEGQPQVPYDDVPGARMGLWLSNGPDERWVRPCP
jgi:hypothetical protein